MGRDENPESVKQWDAGFKSSVSISKVFFILDAALAISEEYPASSSRTILKQVCCARSVGEAEISNLQAFAFGG